MTFQLSDITFMQVLIFITVAKESSFSKAALKLHMTQPAVTKSIARMERQLSIPLFIRTTRQIDLTREGDYLYRQWKPVFFSMEQALHTVRLWQEEQQMRLRVGLTSTTNPELYFWPLADAFQKKYPQIQLSVESDSMEILRDKLLSGEYDLVFLPDFERYSLEDQTLGWRWAARDHVWAYMSPEHPLAAEKNLTLAQLAPYGLMVLSESNNPNYIKDLTEMFQKENLTPKITRSMKNAYTIKSSIRDLAEIIIADAYFDIPTGSSIVRRPVVGHENGIICAFHRDHTLTGVKDFLEMLP
ncbi:DNA-binding transcriptional LysR family regulator [Catenibacillus scindens]|uniref:DNA-binding transcriptional LysR family regulator n=1 Tax=Catenibacillus scindens TaxID=673271 RepID=A0A7W8H994_9FIRM|nr:LysR substrate-binding domain-containing protein [Catenibacillus scindens]MBB5264246.1 DNA-binding transcriptional LysR family regulator [Catenibacillus scindens]